jgi:hypothetical protein
MTFTSSNGEQREPARRRRRRAIYAAAVAAVAQTLLGVKAAQATNRSFSTSGSTTWNTAPWSPAGVPVFGDIASIAPSFFGDLTVTYDGFYNIPLDTLNLDGGFGFGVYFQQSGSEMYSTNENIGMFGIASYTQTDGLNLGANLNLAHGGGPSGFGMYTLSGNGNLVMSNESVGEYGNATFTQSGGANTLNSSGYSGLYLGYNAGGFGTYTLSGTGNLTVNGYEVIGTYGYGNFIQSGGTHTINGTAGLFIGAGSGGGGTFTLSGGTLSLPTANVVESVGYTEFGVFNQNGGSHSISGSGGQLVLGYNPAVGGIYNLTAGTINVVLNEIVGHAGNGQLNQSGGTNITANLYVANLFGSNGNYNLSNGATLTVTGSEYDGGAGAGTFNQTGGAHSVAGGLYVGYANTGIGIFTLAGAQSTVSAQFTYVGFSGTGTLNQNGGTHSVGNTLSIGYNSTSAGVYNLNSGALVIGFEEIVGASGTGTLNQTGGIQSIANRLSIGYSPGSTGSLNLTAGQTTMHGPTFVGGSIFGAGGYGVLTIGGGTFDATGNSIQVYPTSNGPSPSQIALSGGVLNVASLVLPDWNRLVFNSGTLNLGTGPNSNPGTLTVGNVGGPAVLNQTNAVSLVSAGSLYVGSGATGTYNLSNGASLSVSASTVLGVFANGTFNQYGGTHTLDTLYLGLASNSFGTYNLSNSATLTQSGSFEYIGNFGNGTFNQTGGSHTLAGTLILGNLAGSTGVYNLTGGTLSLPNGNILVGNSGSGSFYDVGGVAVTQGLVLGVNPGSTGVCSLALAPVLNSAYDTVGNFGNAIFNQAGGTHLTGSISIGVFPSSSGTFTLSGGQLTASGNIYVGGGAGGPGGYGQLNLTGGNLSLGTNSVIICDTASGTNHSSLNITGGPYTIYAISAPDWIRMSLHGTLNLGPGVSSNAGTLTLGDSPGVSATLNQTLGGGFVGAGILMLGSAPLSSGVYNLSNGASLSVASTETIGAAGTGTFNQQGGANAVPFLNIAHGVAAGAYNLSAGTLTSSNVNVGEFGPGTFTHTAGTFTVNGGGVNGLYLGYNAGGFGTYTLSGAGNLIVNGYEVIGTFGYGKFLQNAGSHAINGAAGLYIGGGSGGGGTFALSGGILSLPTPSAIESIGHTEAGIFNQSGGSNSISGSGGQLVVGYNSGSSGTYNLSAGALTVALNEIIGHFGNGTFNHSGGSNTTANLYLANQPNSIGTYNLSNGATLTVTGSEYDGVLGAGVFNQTGGVHTINGATALYIGSGSGGGSGTFTLSGGTLILANSNAAVYVGYTEPGSFFQSGGTHTCSYLALGTGASPSPATATLGTGAYALTGGTLNATVSEDIGQVYTGTFTQTAGLNHTRDLIIADTPFLTATSVTGTGGNPNGSYLLSGGALTVDDIELVANEGPATLVQNGGTNTAEYLYIGANVGGNGTYTLNAGVLAVTGAENVGILGAGSLFQNGGVHNVAGMLSVGFPQGNSAGSLVLSGGSLSAGSVSISSHGAFTLTSGVLTATSLVNNGLYAQSGGTATLGPTSGSAALSAADGTFTLSAGSLSASTVSITGGNFHQSGGSFQFAHIQQQGGSALFDGSANLIVDNADYTLTGGTLTVANMEIIGAQGTGSFQQSGASLHSLTSTTTNGLFLGLGPAANGFYHLDGGTLASGATVWVGYGGTGTLTQTGGSLTIGNGHSVVLGGLASGAGVYNQSGGTLSADNETIGYAGSGLFNHTGGTNSTGNLFIGGSFSDPTSTGSYLLSGSASLIAANEYIGAYGAGNFAQTGAANTLTGTLFVGGPRGGAYSLAAGTLTLNTESASTVVAYSGTGVFQQTGGIHSINSTGTNGLFLGYTSFGAGDYHLDGGTLASGATVWVGYGGTGTLTQTAGLLSVSNGHALILGGLSGSTGSYNLQGGTLNPTNEYLGEDGNASFVHAGGSNFTGLLAVGLGTNGIGSGAYTLSGAGSLNASVAEFVGYITQGTFNQSGGANVTPVLALGVLAPTSSGAYNLSGGTLQTDSETIGNLGSGVFTQTGGSHTINGTSGFFLAGATGSTGNYTLTAGTLTVPNASTYVGYAANATFVQSGGSFVSSNALGGIYLGYNSGASGTVTLSGGFFQSNHYEQVGASGHGAFRQIGGTNVVSLLSIGFGTSGVGAYTLEQGALNSEQLTVGESGSGAFIQNGGEVVTHSLSIGSASNAVGSYTLNAGTLTVLLQSPVIAREGTGVFTQNGGTLDTSATDDITQVGLFPTASGTCNLTGGLLLSGSGLYLGIGGKGVFIQSGGTHSCADLQLGVLAGATGSYSLSGDGVLQDGARVCGVAGTGAFTQTGGTHTSNSITLGKDQGGVGTYTLAGNGVLATDVMYVGRFGTGTYTQNGGTANFGTVTVSATPGSSSGTLNLSGGSLSVASLLINQGGALAQTGGTLIVAQSVTNHSTFNLIAGQATLGAVGGAGATFIGGAPVTGTALVSAASLSQPSLTINNGGRLVLRSAAQRLTDSAATLQMNGSGTLDLTNHELLTNTSPGTIKSYLASAYDPDGNADWNQPGLTSSIAIADPNKYSIGYAYGGDPSAQDAGVTTLTGAPLGPMQTVVRAVLAGDANLDGGVDFFDLSQLLGYKYNTGQPASYTDGDLNYDGVVDFFDLTVVLSANYNTGITFSETAAAAGPQIVTPTPEPSGGFASLALGAAASGSLVKRRRRAFVR